MSFRIVESVQCLRYSKYKARTHDDVRWTRRLAHHLRKKLTKLSELRCRYVDSVLFEMRYLMMRSVSDTGNKYIVYSGVCHIILCDFRSKELLACWTFGIFRTHQTILVKCMSTHTRDYGKSCLSKQECHVRTCMRVFDLMCIIRLS